MQYKSKKRDCSSEVRHLSGGNHSNDANFQRISSQLSTNRPNIESSSNKSTIAIQTEPSIAIQTSCAHQPPCTTTISTNSSNLLNDRGENMTTHVSQSPAACARTSLRVSSAPNDLTPPQNIAKAGGSSDATVKASTNNDDTNDISSTEVSEFIASLTEETVKRAILASELAGYG